MRALILFAVAVLTLSTTSCGEAPEVAGTPEKAARMWAEAIEAGDGSAAAEVCSDSLHSMVERRLSSEEGLDELEYLLTAAGADVQRDELEGMDADEMLAAFFGAPRVSGYFRASPFDIEVRDSGGGVADIMIVSADGSTLEIEALYGEQTGWRAHPAILREQFAARPPSDRALEVSCRSNMETFASAQRMFHSQNGRYAASLAELEEILTGATELTCPLCEQTYLLEAAEGSYTVSCPHEAHGSIVDGTASWQ